MGQFLRSLAIVSPVRVGPRWICEPRAKWLWVYFALDSKRRFRDRDYRYKHTEYAARGIAEYWIVDPEKRQIMVCQWVEGQYEDQVFQGNQCLLSAVVPGFALTVEQLFTMYW